MFTKKTIRDIDLNNKRVILREDFNVPVNEHGVVTDDYHIRQALPTIEHLRGNGAKIIIIAHLGRPEGKPNPDLSLMPVAAKLSELLHLPVKFANDCLGGSAVSVTNSLQPGEICLLENLRFHSGEEANDQKFAKEIASLGEVFVQDGFGVAYRKHASTEAITHYLPSVAGLLLEKEVNTITNAIDNPKLPLAVIIGGTITGDKLKLIEKYIEKADYVAVVGSLANTFLKAEGISVGKSLVEDDYLKDAENLIEKAVSKMCEKRFTFYLPHDVVVAEKADNTAETRVVDIGQHVWSDINSYPKPAIKSFYTIKAHEQIVDIGPMSAASIAGSLKLCKTAIWNGPAGIVEVKGLHTAAAPFAHGSNIILEALVGERAGELNKPCALICGADSVSYVENQPHARDRLGFLSTGGGASLEVAAGNKLPGIEALQDKEGK